MILKKLSLLNYKNIAENSFEFESKINAIVGKNGIGKTTILDAIYHLAVGKSYFNPLSTQNIKHGEEFFVIDGVFEKENRNEQIICSYKKAQKKILKRNGKIYEKFSEHIGLIPIVIISPSDTDLIIEGSETRRKFIDNVISTFDATYLKTLINYQKTLQQRNALLKYFALNQVFDADNLNIYNEQLSEFGHIIFTKRKDFLEKFIPVFQELYEVISENAEKVTIEYESQLYDDNLDTLLIQNLQKDRITQYTTCGIHKDDVLFNISGFPVKKFGSQGQQKSFLIALKLAQFDFIKKHTKTLPILLFDDIFDKLDAFRVQQIVNMVNDDVFGQIFISDTHPERTENIIKQTHKSYKIFNI
ncbi:DNA replication and repair protein RecF [Flavobacterium sp.]|uniref:DNA replication/repair protein RecF n=1 Tax=Flavobacterium sp. TaxID=239 RepID=UPI00333FB8D2